MRRGNKEDIMVKLKYKFGKELWTMVVQSKSMGLFGLDAYVIDVEADLAGGMPAFDIVGLPDAAVKESRDRVRASMKNMGFDFPLGRITINLAPADTKKERTVLRFADTCRHYADNRSACAC